MSSTSFRHARDAVLERGSTVYCDCPGCGYKGGLAITNADGRVLYHCHAGCSQGDVWRVVRNFQPLEQLWPSSANASNRSSDAENFARQLWEQSEPSEKTPVARYLKSRGITGVIPASLRFLAHHPHRPTGTAWPIMIAAVTNSDGKLRAVHRTYLAVDGSAKASIKPEKMTLGPVARFACHLAMPDHELAVSEGIETGLSVQAMTGIPTWAALSTGGLRNLVLPPLPRARLVTIAADADKIGIKSARIAAARWKLEGRKVEIVTPPRPGTDFNDVHMTARL